MIRSDKFYQDFAMATENKKFDCIPSQEKYDEIVRFLKNPMPTTTNDYDKRIWRNK